MADACCIWCSHAKQSYRACGIICGMNSFIRQDGHCPNYEQLPGVDLAQNEMVDHDDDFISMANTVKWMLRETGERWPLLGAAVIDRLQEIAEEVEAWGDVR